MLKISSQIGGSKLASLALAQTGYSRLFDLLRKFSGRKFLMVGFHYVLIIPAKAGDPLGHPIIRFVRSDAPDYIGIKFHIGTRV